MSSLSNELRAWYCPNCGRQFTIPAWANDPVQCPSCGGDEGETPEPTLAQKSWNLAKSIAAFVADGMRTVDRPTYEARLTICDACDQRRDRKCAACGCHIALKARASVWQCPLGRWPALITTHRQSVPETDPNPSPGGS